MPIDVKVTIASDHDVNRIREMLVEPFAEDFEDFEDEAEAGGTCFVAKSNGQITGYSWVRTEPVELGCKSFAQYQTDAAYLCASLVFPEFRGNRIFQCLTREIYIHLKNNGYRYACNLTHTDNLASIKARRRMGARIDTLRFLKLPLLPLKVFGHRRFQLERIVTPEPAG